MSINEGFPTNYDKNLIPPSKESNKESQQETSKIEHITKESLEMPSVESRVKAWEKRAKPLQKGPQSQKIIDIAKKDNIVTSEKPEVTPRLSKSQTAILKITNCNGSKQEIKKILKEIFPEPQKSIPLLMNVVNALAERGETVKASHLFFFLQFHFYPDQTVVNFTRIGKSFLDYGLKHRDVMALDCAEFHLAMSRASPDKAVRQEGESLIQKTKVCLQNICLEGDEGSKKKARNVLDQIEIADLLDPYNGPITKEELQTLKTENPDVKKAFDLAEALQKRVDTTDAPEYPSEHSKEVQIKDVNQSIPIHTIITGKPQKEGEPCVILEGGLGVIAEDWQFVQRLMGDHRTISYDREGIAWSGRGEDPVTPERSLSQLKTILEESGLKPPYIFVGHSYGGFLGQLFALEYPEEVKGLVLVDSALETVTPDADPPPKTTMDYLPPAVTRFVARDRGHCLDDQTALSVNIITAKTQNMSTYGEELNSAFPRARGILSDKLKKNGQPFSCPIKVITAGIDQFDNDAPTEHRKKVWSDWQSGQRDLPSRSSSKDSEQIFASESDHFIMHHQPEMVADQIKKLFELS